MQKFTICLIVIFLTSCSKNPNGTISTLPVPPSNLTASAPSDTQVNLMWIDNSTNEMGFKIERKNIGGLYSVVGTVGININVFADTGLIPNTTYSYRVFSFNNEGNSPIYSNEFIVTTRTSNASTNIFGQVWMTRNLDVAIYRNGDPIPQVTDPNTWKALTTGAYCYYENDSATYAAVYGKLYNWYAVNDPRGLPPAGWHVPSDAEWTTLENNLGGAVAGGKMKEVGTMYWASPNTGANNSSGFTALPGGLRTNSGMFFDIGTSGGWWSSSEAISTSAWCRTLFYNADSLTSFTDNKLFGQSVRCVKD